MYEGYPYLLAEMYAYSMAAAHDNLPHLQLENYMVSNTESSGEGWPLVDALEDACVPPDEGIVCISVIDAYARNSSLQLQNIDCVILITVTFRG